MTSVKIKKFLLNLGVLTATVGITLLLCEFGARLVVNPSDFLRLEVVPDEILGAVPSPSSMAGFDKWGFRNRKVPESADIVAVGDSHTYGNTARMVDSWPYVLGELTGQRVYNMGLGGYGPNQYFYLSKTKAFNLKPKILMWGLYMGDDFENAFTITYGLKFWASLRQLPDQKAEANIWESTPESPGLLRGTRVWLSRHSVLYQLVFHTGLGGRVKGQVQIKNAAQLYPGDDTVLNIPEKNILEAFRPKAVLVGLNRDSPAVHEGMRITFELLKEMKETCEKKNVQFVVVVIPTKEMVFSDYLEHNSDLPLRDVLDKLLASERSARAQLFGFMTESKIPYVDTLPALRASVSRGLYASSAGDMHPNKNGYHAIAESAAEFLRLQGAEKQPAAVTQ